MTAPAIAMAVRLKPFMRYSTAITIMLSRPPANLKASVAGYKPDGDAFGKDPSKFERLGPVSEDAEYYVAFTGCPYIYSICGGLDVNENFQVLDTEGNVIPGLFACGTDSMGVLFNENKAYTNYGGCAQGYCFVSGRDTGSFAAKQILAE